MFLSLFSYFQECFNAPYGTQHFREYSEPVPGPTTKSLSTVAKECQVYVVGGNCTIK